MFITIDVRDLFTVIPHDIGLAWFEETLMDMDFLEPDEFRIILENMEIVLKNNYVYFHGEYYHQIQGVAMGAACAPTYANIVMLNASDKVEQLEGRVETYRKKLENMNDLRRQVKSLEEKNTVYMQNAVSLEEELRKANAARGQLEAYKIQVQELHNTLSEETRRGDQLEFEVKHLKEKYEAVEKEKERIITERDTLKETNEELKCAQLEQGHLLQAGSFPPRSPSHDNLAAEILPVDHKEKLIRLQHENKMLRLQLEGSENERIKELQGQLAEALRKVNKEETESRLYKQRSLELQQQVDELQKILNETGSTAEESSLLKQKLELEIEKLHNANGNLREKEGLVEDLQQELHLNSQKIEELQAALRKKDDDMKAMEDRYKMYLEKARNVIKTLDPKCNPATAEYQALKKKLGEKDARIQTLEKECEQAKLREYEENLIVTAWYNKSLAFQRAAIESRLGRKNPNAIPSTQSFLTQQRQVTNSGRSLSVAIPATASK
ncbi:protein Hook homolog 1-like [Protopterus annectens]|uniref:protein Hook homolog 1-like n=1 Tax=Protopterus annectens TaxID=7888 RepID=UPI001CFA69EE|nr:protein Hook homolog 1-like [Protopterus annectens]